MGVVSLQREAKDKRRLVSIITLKTHCVTIRGSELHRARGGQQCCSRHLVLEFVWTIKREGEGSRWSGRKSKSTREEYNHQRYFTCRFKRLGQAKDAEMDELLSLNSWAYATLRVCLSWTGRRYFDSGRNIQRWEDTGSRRQWRNSWKLPDLLSDLTKTDEKQGVRTEGCCYSRYLTINVPPGFVVKYVLLGWMSANSLDEQILDIRHRSFKNENIRNIKQP